GAAEVGHGDRIGARRAVHDHLIAGGVPRPRGRREIGVHGPQIRARGVVDGDDVVAGERADIDGLDGVEVHRDGGDVTGQADVVGHGGDLDLLGDVAVVERQAVDADAAVDGVVPIARIPLDGVV